MSDLLRMLARALADAGCPALEEGIEEHGLPVSMEDEAERLAAEIRALPEPQADE
ncbi:MAG TPA: hypothetical protein VKG82_03410 [Solirubrobacteraceae bacterium]|nr:hypothetical protein [Solirubrobacteraceae bacterium]